MLNIKRPSFVIADIAEIDPLFPVALWTIFSPTGPQDLPITGDN